ncbi:B12-binding domain-containing radical SAM protein [bacterium]|nr:B12-binding domain-containing radical SAM protein [candidate division CSSED10-310 bacterium]
MKIALLTPTPPDISAFGIRALSAYLKRDGHDVTCIFLPGGIEKLRHGKAYRYEIPSRAMERIRGVVSDARLIGIACMSNYRDRAVQLSRRLKDTGAFIVWGGIHAEVRPDDALSASDGVCLTEGESVMKELIRRLETGVALTDIPGLALRGGPGPDEIACPPLIADLDSLPFADFGVENHWVLDPAAGQINPLTPERLAQIMPLMPAPGGGAMTVYRIMASRGCPHRCSYCANRAKADRHPGQKYLRFRSPGHVLDELKQVIRTYPFIQGIHFFDDVFTAMPEEDLKELCRRYETEIGLPYYLQVSPSTLTREQLELFLDTGMVFIEMGIQTGSPRIQSMYHRPETPGQILDAARLIHRFRSRLITPHYHVILDNPWESRDDVRATLTLLTRIPGKFKLCLASLTLYPGTEVYEQAVSENLIRDEEREIYRKPFYIPKGRYLNYLIYLTDIHWIPRSLLRWLGTWPAELFDRPVFGPLFDLKRRITEMLRLAAKGVSAVAHGRFDRIGKYFRRVK